MAVIVAFGLGILAGTSVVGDRFVNDLQKNYDEAIAERDAALELIEFYERFSEGLQPTMVRAVTDVLSAERKRRPMAALLVEQNVAFAWAVADRFAVLKRGEIVARGDVADPGALEVVEQHLRV